MCSDIYKYIAIDQCPSSPILLLLLLLIIIIIMIGYMSYLEHFIPYNFGLNFAFYAAVLSVKANSVDPDQTVPFRSCLIWVCTV